MIEAAVVANTVFLLTWGSARVQNRWLSRIIVLAWVVLSTGFLWWLAHYLGATFVNIGPFGLPIYGLSGLGLSLILIPRNKNAPPVAVWILWYAIVWWYATYVHWPAINLIAGLDASELLRSVAVVGHSTALCLSLLVPLAVLTPVGERPLRLFGLTAIDNASEQKKAIIKGMLLYFAILVPSNMIMKGHSFDFFIIVPFWSAILAILLRVFHGVFIRHLVAFGLGHFVVEKLLGEEDAFWLEVVLLGVLFGALNWNDGWPIIIRESLLGMSFAYLYLKTKRLSYGIIVASFTAVFTV